ncbi:MAG: hypothetical protein WBF17_23015, partial [Phycisphaerae bacterium]
VAKHLLRLFEKHPEHWEAVGYLNIGDAGASKGLAGHLSAWHGSSPEKHKPFVRSVAEMFGIELPNAQ